MKKSLRRESDKPNFWRKQNKNGPRFKSRSDSFFEKFLEKWFAVATFRLILVFDS